MVYQRLDALDLPTVDMSLMRTSVSDRRPREEFARDLESALNQTGFVAVTNFNPRIKELRDSLTYDLETFFALSLDEKKKFVLGNDGQRGYTPIGVEQSGYTLGRDTEFEEWREHIFLGTPLPADHPINQYQAWGYQKQNPHFPSLPLLTPRVEELARLIHEEEQLLYEGLEVAFDLPRGTIAGPHAYGNSAVRIHNYPAFPKEDIVGATEKDGFKTAHVRLKDGREIKHLIRAAPHTDIDTAAFLLGAQKRGLILVDKKGNRIPVSAANAQAVWNGGDYLEHITGGRYKSPVHAVEAPLSALETNRISIVFFSHQRLKYTLDVLDRFKKEPKAHEYRPEFEGVLLYRRLQAIGYLSHQEFVTHETTIRGKLISDKEFVRRAYAWEKQHGASENCQELMRYPEWVENYLKAA